MVLFAYVLLYMLVFWLVVRTVAVSTGTSDASGPGSSTFSVLAVTQDTSSKKIFLPLSLVLSTPSNASLTWHPISTVNNTQSINQCT